MAEPGTLTLVGTPIGNLGDLSRRAIEAITAAELIACESPAAASRLLSFAGTRARLVTYREANRDRVTVELVGHLSAGRSVVLLSEAGMPGVSDPGRVLVEACHRGGIAVTCVPGASALTAALALCGLPARRVAFEGFLPRKGRERRSVLEELAREPRTLVLFEAPHRLLRTLADLRQALGPRQVFLGRELTKKFEELRLGSFEELAELFCEREPRGEFVLVVSPPELPASEPSPVPEGAAEWLVAQGLGSRQVADTLARFWSISRKQAYALAVAAAAEERIGKPLNTFQDEA